MPQFIVSYDLHSAVPDPHSEFIRQAFAFGWPQYIKVNTGILNKLPNTTLVGDFKTIADAENSLDRVTVNTSNKLRIRVRVRKIIIISAPNTISNSDEH